MTPPKEASLPKIGYILQTYPALTVTFIYREVIALQKLGLSIDTFSVWKPRTDQVSEEARPLIGHTSYIFPLSWVRFIVRHLYYLLRHPRRYVGTAWHILTRPGESRKNRTRTFFHFCEAVYLAWEIQQRQIPHLHAHFTINAASIAMIIARLLGITFSFTAHNIFFTDRLLIKEKIRAARFISVISKFSRDTLLGLVPGEDWASKTHIVHCGISPDEFLPVRPKPSNPTPLIFFVAQLQERKGAPYLVEACHLLKQRGISFHCTMAGHGPDKPVIEQQIHAYELEDLIDLAGAIDMEQVKDYLHRADIFVMPCILARNGDMDGIPVALMEAMACEIPVVSTHVSGIPELIDDGVNGLLVAEKNALALADALQRLIEDAELRLRLGRNGRLKVLSEFNIETSAAQLAQLFTTYLAPQENH